MKMRNVILLMSMLMFVIGGALAQTDYDTISATYSLGDIMTDGDFDQFGEVSTCPGPLNVPVPNNAIIVSVDVEYSMTAITNAAMNSAWSQVVCTSPGGAPESQLYQGTGGWGTGTELYGRNGLTIANGVTPVFNFGVNFDLYAGTSYWESDGICSDLWQVVDNNTWTVTVIYLAAGAPGTPTNPSPADMAQLVDLNADLGWTFGANTTTYDLYLGTDNPPTTIVVPDGTPGGTTGSYDPGTLLEATEYFWRVVGKNANNENPGIVWSFTTKCATPTYPSFEGFDASATEFPDCWIPLSSSSNQYSAVAIYQYDGLSQPYSIQFIADAEPSPNLVFVLPEIGTISDKMISLYGRNDIDWLTGNPVTNPIEVGTITDPFDINTFTSFTSFVPGSEWDLLEVFFADYTGTDTYIAIKGAVPQYGAVYVDNVTVDFIPTCIKPLDLVEVDIQAEQATIGWTDLNGATSWNVEYGISPYTPTGTPTVTGVTNPATLTGLLDGTYYDIYVQTDCGGGDLSAWSWPITILTDCLPWAVPFSEDFGVYPPWPEVYSPPLCWATIDVHSSEFGGMGFQEYESHTGMGVWMAPEYDPTAQLILVSPPIAPAINTLRSSVWAKTSTDVEVGMLLVGTITDPADYNTFTPIDTVVVNNEHQLYTVYFNNYAGSDNHIAWKHNAEEYATYQLFIDDITVESIPSCVEPYQPRIDGITNSTAMMNWTDPVESATDWQIELGAPGFTPGTGAETNAYAPTAAAAEMHSFDMTGLSAATTYDAYIQTNCEGDYSVWVGPITFLSGFDALALPVTDDFESGMGITGNDPANTQDWAITTTLQHSGVNSVVNQYGTYDNNILYILGTFDLTAKADAMLTFWHIAKTEQKADHCYVEISTDGGVTYDQLPESTYEGAGWYREEGLYTPFDGPCFDELSYTAWGTSNTTPDNSWWRKEYFDLTSYNTFDNVIIRFRLASNSYTTRAGWFIDDIAIETLGTPTFYADPLVMAETVTPVMPAMVDLTMGNSGTLPATYAANVVYDEVDLYTEDFDLGIPGDWTIINNGNNSVTWTSITPDGLTWPYYGFNDTPYAICDGYQNYGPNANTMDDYLITPVIDASAYIGAALQLEFDQAFYANYTVGDTAEIDVYDGAQWVNIYTSWITDGQLSWNSNGKHKAYNVSAYANANFQVRFHYIEGPSGRGQYFAIDNFRLRASTSALGWLTIDGAEVTSGTAMPDADNFPSIVTVDMNAAGLAPGVYTADILVTSTDAGNPSTTIPVTMTVVAGSTISGNLTYKNGASTALNGCSVELRNDADAVLFTTTTDAAGYYEFAGLIDGDYTIYTSTTKAWGGSNTFDATLILRYSAGVPGYDVFTNLQKRAADVNKSNTVNTFDATLISRRAASIATPTWTAPDYVFDGPYPSTPALIGLPVNISGSNATVNYQGLCSGDVNGNYAPPAE